MELDQRLGYRSWPVRILRSFGNAASNLFLLGAIVLVFGILPCLVAERFNNNAASSTNSAQQSYHYERQSSADSDTLAAQTDDIVENRICRPVAEVVGHQISGWLLTDGYRVAGEARSVLENIRRQAVALLPTTKSPSNEVARDTTND